MTKNEPRWLLMPRVDPVGATAQDAERLMMTDLLDDFVRLAGTDRWAWLDRGVCESSGCNCHRFAGGKEHVR